MKVSRDEVQRRMVRFREACQRAGIKRTQQRIEVFREVASISEHPDVEAIYQRVRTRMPTISLDTVYRTLWLLKDLGLVTTLGTHHGRIRFDANISSHHHFVCTRCGMAQDFYSRALDGLEIPEVVKKLGSVETTYIEFRGLCSRCSKMKKGK